MSQKSKHSKKEIDQRFEDIFENNTRYGIVMAIRTFGSMNIKLLASIMGKTVSTIHHHIKEMTQEPSVIIVDNEKTTTLRGIYYKLSDITEEKYPKDTETVFEEDIPKVMNRVLQLSDEDLSKIMILRMISGRK